MIYSSDKALLRGPDPPRGACWRSRAAWEVCRIQQIVVLFGKYIKKRIKEQLRILRI